MPAGFWNNFKPELITKNESNQGPYGGTRKIKWQSKSQNSLSRNDFIQFAISNQWILVDSLDFNESKIDQSNLDKYSKQILLNHLNSLDFKSELSIFVFKTKWIAVEPGDLSETLINGFIIFNLKNKTSRVYHLWGE